jgi:ACS family hexuronate transporter-like MFS transporter
MSDMFPSSTMGSVVGAGGMAGSVGSRLFAVFFFLSADHILQLTHRCAGLFGIARSARLLALAILCRLAPWLRKVELTA